MTGREEELLATGRTARTAELITALLVRCVTRLGSGRPSADDIRALCVGDREALLLRLRRATLGDRMECVVTCVNERCGERVDLELTVGDLLVEPDPAAAYWYDESFGGEGGPIDVRFRLPTGADQEIVAAIAAIDEETAGSRVLARCVAGIAGSDGELAEVPAEIAHGVSARMSELDPQAEIHLRFTCPGSAKSNDVLFDTAAFFFAELGFAAERLRERCTTRLVLPLVGGRNPQPAAAQAPPVP